MRMPPDSATFTQHVRYGQYLARRLRTARKSALAADVEKATSAVLAAGRHWEDADAPIQDALADRDAADDDLDEIAQTVRARLAGRSADAARSAPYTLIFPDGVAYYTAAPLDEEVPRYSELGKRLESHLPDKDDLRAPVVKQLHAGVGAFKKASDELAAARTDESLAATRLGSAIDAWERQVEKCYGALVSDVGRAKAEAYFPKTRASKKGAAGSGDGEKEAEKGGG